eukprot:3300579-Rhodomonas_salina.1
MATSSNNHPRAGPRFARRNEILTSVDPKGTHACSDSSSITSDCDTMTGAGGLRSVKVVVNSLSPPLMVRFKAPSRSLLNFGAVICTANEPVPISSKEATSPSKSPSVTDGKLSVPMLLRSTVRNRSLPPT